MQLSHLQVSIANAELVIPLHMGRMLGGYEVHY